VIGRRILSLAVAAALLAACKNTSSKPGPRFLGPAGLAMFQGVTVRSPALVHPYLAVADLRGDELRLIDPVDGEAVLAPGKVLALSVPTEARPALIAAGPLGDLDGQGKAVAKPDLLVAAGTGTSLCQAATNLDGVPRLSGCIQVVQTWAEADGTLQTAVVNDLAIALAEVPGAEDAIVRSLTVLAVTDAAGAVVPGKARVAAGLDGGRLLLADYARTTATGAGDAIVIDGAPVVLDLGFEPLSISAAPGGARLYVATTDLLPAAAPVFGVAEVDLRGPLSAALRWRALDAGGPTTVVLAAQVRRFSAFRDATGTSTWDPNRDAYGAEALRVYAAREEGSCGRSKPVGCGLVVLDPVAGGADGTGGRALDPAPPHSTAGRYQAEIPIPGRVVALAAVTPPTVGGLCDDGSQAPCQASANAGSSMPYQSLYLASGARWASTLAAAVSTTGSVFLLDLGHDGLANTRDWLSTTLTTSATQVTTVTFVDLPGTTPGLAAWNTIGGGAPALTRDKTVAKPLVRATPGFTHTDTWTVSWQGGLPGLSGLDGQAKVDATGAVEWIAIQRPTGRTDQPFTGIGRLYDARFAIQPAVEGVRLGDIVRVTPVREPGDALPPDVTAQTVAIAEETQYCPIGTFELEVTELLPPTSDYPGGALKVRERWAQAATTFGTDAAGVARPATPKATCMSKAGAFQKVPRPAFALKPVSVTVLAGELLLSGLDFGYAGRPVPRAVAGTPYLLQHDVALDEGSCPRLEADPLPATACDQACQAACEALLLSRKSRRFAYVYSQCAAADTECKARWSGPTTVNGLTFPNPGGPVLGLELAWTTDGITPVAPDLTAQANWPVRGTLLTVLTTSGLVVQAMQPITSGTPTGTLLPNGVATWSRPDFTRATTDHGQVFASYPANQVITFQTTSAASEVGLFR